LPVSIGLASCGIFEEELEPATWNRLKLEY